MKMQSEYGFWIIAVANLILSISLSKGLNCKRIDFQKNAGIKKRICFLISTVLYVVFMTIRKIDIDRIGGNDSITMYRVYERVNGYLFFDIWPNLSYRELGYSWLTWWGSNNNIHYKIILMGMYIFSIYMLIIFLDNIDYTVKNPISFLALGLLVAYLLYEINLQRNCMAIFVALNVYWLWLKEKYWKGIALLLLGMQIHLSMIILVPLVFLIYCWKRKNFSLNMIFSMMLIIDGILLGAIPLAIKVIPFLQQYKKYFIKGFNGIKQPLILLVVLVFFLLPQVYRRLDDINKGLIVILGYSMVVLPFAIYISMAYRLLFYFMPVAFILVGKAMAMQKMKIWYLYDFLQVCLSLIVVGYGYCMFYANFYLTGGVYNYVFDSIWNLPF